MRRNTLAVVGYRCHECSGMGERNEASYDLDTLGVFMYHWLWIDRIILMDFLKKTGNDTNKI